MFSVKNGQSVKICSPPGQCCGKVDTPLYASWGGVYLPAPCPAEAPFTQVCGVLQPSGRKIHLIDVVSFIFARNSRQISMSSASACVTAALYFGV